MITRRGIKAKCHSTAGNHTKAAIMDKLGVGQTKQNPNERFKVMADGHFTFVSCFCVS